MLTLTKKKMQQILCAICTYVKLHLAQVGIESEVAAAYNGNKYACVRVCVYFFNH